MAPAASRARAAPLLAPAAFAGSAALLAAAGPLPAGVQAAILAVAVIASLPHGASDIVLAERLLRARLGAAWRGAFVLAYLTAACATLLVWIAWPAGALGLFLVLSLVHFAATDLAAWPAAASRLGWIVAAGGAPIVVPALAHPAEIEGLFALLAGPGGQALAEALRMPGALIWGGAVLAAMLGADAGAHRGPLAAWLIAVAAVFVLLPPLLAFALYFGVLHNARALGDLARTTGLRQVDFLRRSAWPSLAALAGLLAAWWIMQAHHGQSDAAIRAAFIGIAALTVPHMILAGLATGRPWTRQGAPARSLA